jgi:superfamily II DNA or RNA helicase
MAERIALSNLEDADKEFIQTTLEVHHEKDGQLSECFDMDDTNLYLPLAFARTHFELETKPTEATESCQFTAQLREEQKRVYDIALRDLNVKGFSIVSARPGFGKTITALAIACSLRIKTVIVVNKLILISQWKESVANFTTATMQYVTASTKKLNESATLYVVNAINISKKPREFWSPIKFLIVDELHQIVTRVLSQALLKVVPDFSLGLSATPYRFDEYDKAIKWFFGTNPIGKRLKTQHAVTVVKTGWTPRAIRYTRKGVDWNSVLEEQCCADDRNNLIVDFCSDRPERMWLVLVKRVAHAIALAAKFEAKGIACATLVGTAVTFDKTCKVLIGTTSKIGVGFDHAAIDALCIAADVKNYFVQFLGRCMRNPDTNPIVVDFEDDYGPLRKHLAERIKEYKKHGGTVNNA